MKLFAQHNYTQLSEELVITDSFDQAMLSLGNSAIRLGALGIILNSAIGYGIIQFASLTYKTKYDGTILWLFTIPIHSDYSWFIVWFIFLAGFIPSLILLRSGLSLRYYWASQLNNKLIAGVRSLRYNLVYNLICNLLILLIIIIYIINYLVFIS